MSRVIKIIIFQSLWYICAFGGSRGHHWTPFLLSLIAVVGDAFYFRYPINPWKYGAFACLMVLSGFLIDMSFNWLGLFSWGPGVFYPLSIAGIWLIFTAYYPELFQHFMQKPLVSFILGAIFGPFAYLSGHWIGSLKTNFAFDFLTILFAVVWGLFFMGSLQFFRFYFCLRKITK